MSLFALLAGRNHELDRVAFVERLVAATFDVREVDEDVSTVRAGDEAGTLFGAEELHCARSHCRFLTVGAPVDRSPVNRIWADDRTWS